MVRSAALRFSEGFGPVADAERLPDGQAVTAAALRLLRHPDRIDLRWLG